MKYTTFRSLVALGGAAVLVGGIAWCTGGKSDATRTRSLASPGTGALPASKPTPRAAAVAGIYTDLLLQRLGTEAKEDKWKDALGSTGPKVNLYAEGNTWTRAKVDLDRDEKWDEKWELKGGVVTRQVAAQDDERYGPVQTWADGQWAGAAEPAAAPPVTSSPAGPREVDQAMAQALKSPVQGKVKDATKGRPFKINLYSDDGKRFNRAKVDLDRDDKWDESWTLGADGSTERKVSPADDETYTEVHVLDGDRWVRK
jgi:hypothetical protein